MYSQLHFIYFSNLSKQPTSKKIQDEETQLAEYHNPPDEGGAEDTQDDETQLDEYHNPPDKGGGEDTQDDETQLDEYQNPPDKGGAEKSQDEETQLREYHNPPDEGGAEDTQDDVTQSDEYRNPEGPESRYWNSSWILGIIIITINVPLPRYPLHTLFIFAYIKYGQAKAKAGLKEYIAKNMVFAHTTPTEHSRDSVLNVEQPTTS